MENRYLGNSGLEVSEVGLGCMNFGMANDEAESGAVVEKALDLGINFFDTADVYGERGLSEEWLGRALGKRRQQVLIATKFAGPMSETDPTQRGGSRRYIMSAVEASLKRLNTDYIDLYQMHTPDSATPIEETMRALDDLVRQGKVRYLGSSNYAAWQLVDAQWTARENHLNGFVSAQNRYSVISRDLEKEVVPAAQKHGVGIIPYFPLESGVLTGKYKRGEESPEGTRLARWGDWGRSGFASEAVLDKVDKLDAIGRRFNHSLLELAMGWLLDRNNVASVIAGVTSPSQLEQNVAAASWRPSREESALIDEVTAPEAPRGRPGR